MAVAEELNLIGKTVAIFTVSGISGGSCCGTLSIACLRETMSHKKQPTIKISRIDATMLVQMERISFSTSRKGK
jgi:hypothetical protein